MKYNAKAACLQLACLPGNAQLWQKNSYKDYLRVGLALVWAEALVVELEEVWAVSRER